MRDSIPSLKFLCDEMLCRLGRWLRAAGYDTIIANAGQSDRYLIDTAFADGRWLLTRDRKLDEFKLARNCVILMAGKSVPAQVDELSQQLPINWLHAPFSRCLVCNAPLRMANPDRLAEVPEFSRNKLDALYVCSGCGHLYWHGSHVRRMRAKLKRWKFCG